jgi:hypothetical protein
MRWPRTNGDRPRPEVDTGRRRQFIRKFWEEAFDRLERLLQELKRKENNHDPREQ